MQIFIYILYYTRDNVLLHASCFQNCLGLICMVRDNAPVLVANLLDVSSIQCIIIKRLGRKFTDARFQRDTYNTTSHTCYKRNTYANNTLSLLKILSSQRNTYKHMCVSTHMNYVYKHIEVCVTFDIYVYLHISKFVF